MAYVRINMVEFDSPEAMKENSKELNENAGKIFPELQLIAAVATSDTSALSISIYPDKGSADKAIAQRDKHHEEDQLRSLWRMRVTYQHFIKDPL